MICNLMGVGNRELLHSFKLELVLNPNALIVSKY